MIVQSPRGRTYFLIPHGIGEVPSIDKVLPIDGLHRGKVVGSNENGTRTIVLKI